MADTHWPDHSASWWFRASFEVDMLGCMLKCATWILTLAAESHRSIYTPPSQSSLSLIVPFCSFQFSNWLAKPFATAHKYVYLLFSGHFSLYAKEMTRCIAQISAQWKDSLSPEAFSPLTGPLTQTQSTCSSPPHT